MARTDIQQIQSLIDSAQNILIAFPRSKTLSATGSGLALANFLENLGKRVDIVSSDFKLPGNLRFLPESKRITSHPANLRKFIISINLANTHLKDLSYSLEKDKLNIYLTPEKGSFSSSNITTKLSDFSYNLIITIETPDLNSLGALFYDNTEFFYQTTIINIDNNIHNEHFGQINLIDFNRASSAELIMELIQTIKPDLLTPNIATCLYTSLTVASKNFTSPQVTPRTLEIASQLVTLGAKREEVVTHLLRTKKLSALKLWGRVLARLKSDSKRKLVWSVLTPEDFIKSGADEDQLTGVIEELILGAAEAKTVVLIYEITPGHTYVYIHGGAGRRADDLIKPFAPQGDQFSAKAELPNTSVLAAETKIIEHIKSILPTLES